MGSVIFYALVGLISASAIIGIVILVAAFAYCVTDCDDDDFFEI